MLQVLSVCDYVSALWLTVKWIKLVFLCECYQLPQKHRHRNTDTETAGVSISPTEKSSIARLIYSCKFGHAFRRRPVVPAIAQLASCPPHSGPVFLSVDLRSIISNSSGSST